MRMLIVAAVLALAACTPAENSENMAAGCDARASHTWRGGNADYAVEATSAGPDCARAVATIVVRDSSGEPLFTEAHLAQHVMVLAPARDAAAMQTALQDWVSFENTTMATSSALPDWPETADAPQNGEFPFYPADGYNDRDSYMSLRRSDAPLLCFVQGMESLACLAPQNGALQKVGVQAFPG